MNCCVHLLIGGREGGGCFNWLIEGVCVSDWCAEAEAELAALEDLRLSRATPYVSIDPSSVGET